MLIECTNQNHLRTEELLRAAAEAFAAIDPVPELQPFAIELVKVGSQMAQAAVRQEEADGHGWAARRLAELSEEFASIAIKWPQPPPRPVRRPAS